MLSCNNLSFYYENNAKVLDSISYKFNKSETYLLTGPSGSGKTTFIKCLAGLSSYSGTVNIDSSDIKLLTNKQKANLCGIVFQEYNLFSHLTVLENCTKSLIKVDKLNIDSATKSATYWLHKLGLGALLTRFPSQLSGGQKQRVALARSLAKNVQILILDEPTAAIDEQAKIVFIEVLEVLKQEGITVIISSHDPFLIENLQGCRKIKLQNGRLI